jgi:hypothetical protein
MKRKVTNIDLVSGAGQQRAHLAVHRIHHLMVAAVLVDRQVEGHHIPLPAWLFSTPRYSLVAAGEVEVDHCSVAVRHHSHPPSLWVCRFDQTDMRWRRVPHVLATCRERQTPCKPPTRDRDCVPVFILCMLHCYTVIYTNNHSLPLFMMFGP